MSDVEDGLLWQMKAVGLPEPVREHVFHSTRKWRFDFAWPDRHLAVEVEGGGFVAGRHGRGAGLFLDSVKYNEAALAGWMVLRVTPAMVDDGTAVAFIERAIKA